MLGWPVNTPDANPIENFWGVLKRIIRTRNLARNSIAELKIAAQEEWNRIIVQEIIKDFLRSMNRRMQASIRAR